jgi:hypothetical protein
MLKGLRVIGKSGIVDYEASLDIERYVFTQLSQMGKLREYFELVSAYMIRLSVWRNGT